MYCQNLYRNNNKWKEINTLISKRTLKLCAYHTKNSQVCFILLNDEYLEKVCNDSTCSENTMYYQNEYVYNNKCNRIKKKYLKIKYLLYQR